MGNHIKVLLIILGLIVAFSIISEPAKYEYKEVLVQPRDTLWTLTAAHTEGKYDINELVYETRRINELGNIIYPGQRIRLAIATK